MTRTSSRPSTDVTDSATLALRETSGNKASATVIEDDDDDDDDEEDDVVVVKAVRRAVARGPFIVDSDSDSE